MASRRLLVLTAVAVMIVNAGEFRTRLDRSESVSLIIPRPADAVVNAKSLAISVKGGQSAFHRSVELTQFVQQDLAREFDFSNTQPDAVLGISVVAYEPVFMKEETRMEMRSMNVGTSRQPDYESRSVPVVYRLAHGSITSGILMLDKNGKALDSYQPVANIDRKSIVSVNGQAAQEQTTVDNLNVLKSFRKLAPAGQRSKPIIETPEGLETQMLQTLASEIQRRYVTTSDQVDVYLAVDPELRLGDKLAESGQWKEALDSWTAAAMKKHPADRMYNMAVAKEALAYADYRREGNLDEFIPKFQGAMDLYTSALHADPSEKYMQQAVERLHLAKANIETTRRMKVEQDAATARAVRQAVEGAQKQRLLNAALADKSPDTPGEASFRADVRAELSTLNGDITDAKREELVAFGKRMKLPELRSYRVVSQEIDRKKNIGQSLLDYERVLKPLVSDGKVTPSERAQLKDLARREDLDSADIKSVESKYHFTEVSRGGSGRVHRIAAGKTAAPVAPVPGGTPATVAAKQ